MRKISILGIALSIFLAVGKDFRVEAQNLEDLLRNHYKKTESLAPNDPRIINWKKKYDAANVKFKSKDYRGSMITLTEAVKALAPVNHPFQYMDLNATQALATCIGLVVEGDPLTAELGNLLTAIANTYPNPSPSALVDCSSMAHFMLGSYKQDAGDYAMARKEYETASKLSSKSKASSVAALKLKTVNSMNNPFSFTSGKVGKALFEQLSEGQKITRQQLDAKIPKLNSWAFIPSQFNGVFAQLSGTQKVFVQNGSTWQCSDNTKLGAEKDVIQQMAQQRDSAKQCWMYVGCPQILEEKDDKGTVITLIFYKSIETRMNRLTLSSFRMVIALNKANIIEEKNSFEISETCSLLGQGKLERTVTTLSSRAPIEKAEIVQHCEYVPAFQAQKAIEGVNLEAQFQSFQLNMAK